MCSDPWIYRCIKLEALENFHNRHKSTSNSAQTQNFRSFPVILSCSYCAKLFPLPETPFHVFIKKTFTKHLLYHKFWAAARNTTGMRTLLTALNPGSIARFLSIIWLIWLKSFDNKVKCEQKKSVKSIGCVGSHVIRCLRALACAILVSKSTLYPELPSIPGLSLWPTSHLPGRFLQGREESGDGWKPLY